jgi:hypothetical protein
MQEINDPPTPESLLREALVDRLKALPSCIKTPADHELARVAFERAANFYFQNHAEKPEEGRYLLISQYNVRWTRQMDIDEAERIFGSGIIHIRACLNALGEVARMLGLDDDSWRGRPATWTWKQVEERLFEQQMERHRQQRQLEEGISKFEAGEG